MFIILKTYNFQCGFSTKVPCTFLLQENTDEPEKPKFFQVTEQKKGKGKGTIVNRALTSCMEGQF